MDPLSAIGLAGNLLQISQFAAELLVKAKEIHKAGAIRDNLVLEGIVRNLHKTITEVQQTTKPEISENERFLCSLATQCQEQSDELLGLLLSITAVRRNSLGSLRAAWKSHQLLDRKKELESRLEQTKSQIILQLSHMTRSELDAKLDELKSQRNEDSEEIKRLIQNVDTLVEGLTAVRGWADTKTLAPLWAMAQVSQDSVHVIRKRNTILAAVRFEMMDERFDDVEAAHQRTFEWILNEDPESYVPDTTLVSCRFRDWLSTGWGIFHISGKAGSGKSTLMKFLCNHPKTEELLREWAGEQHLVMSHFFFWKPGTPRQRNVKGLIRGLLYHILRQSPEVIPDILDLEWNEATYAQSIGISDSRVVTAFEKFIIFSTSHLYHKYVFFIDGLDELDGNHREMVERLKRWTDSSRNAVKLCVSSREENIFMDSFLESQRIRIHELTIGDMSKLVWDKLNSHPRFEEMVQDDTRRRSLSGAIVQYSGGIFLWVVLVLRAVMEGLDNGDSLPRLEQKVMAMPRGLEAIFDQIFQSISDVDRNLVNLHLSFRLQSPRGCSLLRHSFLPDLDDDPSFVRKIPVEKLDSGTLDEKLEIAKSLEERIDLARRRINGMCKGLLEIHKPTPHPTNGRLFYQVDLTHRSIIEFLMERKAFIEFLNENLDTVYQLLGETLIAEMKTSDTASGLCFSHEFRYIAWAWNEIRHLSSRVLEIFNTIPDWFPSFLREAQNVLSKRVAPPQQKSLKTPRFLHTYNGVSHIVMSMALPARPEFYSILYYTDVQQVGEILPPALLAKTVSSLLGRNSPHTLACMKLLFSKGVSPNCRLIDSTDRALQDVSISTWHVFLCVALNWCDGWWQDDSWKANICEVMNHWISEGADPQFKARYRPTTSHVLDNRQVFLVMIEYGDGQSLPFPTLAAPRSLLAEFIRGKEFSIGLVEIFEFLQVQCTAKIDTLVQSTSSQKGPPTPNDEVAVDDGFQKTIHFEAVKLLSPQKPLTWIEITFLEGGAFRLARHTHRTIHHVFEGLVKPGHMLPPEQDKVLLRSEMYSRKLSQGLFLEKPTSIP